SADAIDTQLHTERLDPATRAQLHHESALHTLPDGAFVVHEGAAHLVLGDRLLRWTPAGYTAPVPRPTDGRAVVITPSSLVSILRAGWRPLVPLFHPSALG